MSLIVHLMKKDARYLRYEVAIWLLLVLAQAGLVLSGVDARAAGSSLRTLSSIYWALVVLQFVIAVIFAAQLLQCDPLTGTTAFWRTRPVARVTLLASKLAFAAVMLLAVPFVVDVVTSVALGISVTDSAVSACNAVLLRAVILLPALAIAVVTPDVPRFVVSAIVLFVGLLLTQWTMIYLAPQYFALRSADSSATLQASRLVAFYASLIACSLAVVVHQYLSLRTIRSIVLVPVALVVCVLAMNLWRYDFLDRPEPAVDRARFNPDPVTLSLDPNSVDSVPIGLRPGNARASHQRMFGHLVVAGAPVDKVTEPISTRGVLRLQGEGELTSELHIARPLSSRWFSRRALQQQIAMLSALGPLAWSNLDWSQGIDIAAGLIDVPDTIYRAHQGKSGTYSAEVTLKAVGFETTGVMAVRPGARYRRSPRGADIAGVELKDKGDCVVTLREVSLSGLPTIYWFSTSGQYFLVNRTTKEALFPDRDYNAFVFNGNWLEQGGAYLTVRRRVLTFAPPPGSKGPVIDAAWLAQAELVRVEPVSLGVFTKPLKVDEFVLRPLR